MKTAKLGDFFLWEGKVVKVEWVNDGYRAIGFKTTEDIECPYCNKTHEIEVGHEVIESSNNFQEGAKPIQTINEN